MSPQLHPNALLTALCFTIVLGDYDTFSQVRHHGVFEALGPNPPSSRGSIHAANGPVSLVTSQTKETPPSDSNPRTILLNLLGRAWSRVHQRLLTLDPLTLQDNMSESLVAVLTQFTKELSLCQSGIDHLEDSHIDNLLYRFPSVVGFVLPLVLDTVLADCGVPNNTLRRWFRLRGTHCTQSNTPDVAGLTLTSSPGSLVVQQPLDTVGTPESSAEYWDRYCQNFITVPEERFSSATHLADYLYNILSQRDNQSKCIGSYSGESSPGRETSDAWPDYIRIYVDNAKVHQVPTQVIVPMTPACEGTTKTSSSATLSGSQSPHTPISNRKKRSTPIHLPHVIDCLRSQLDVLQLPSNTITSTVDFLVQVEQQRQSTVLDDPAATTTTATEDVMRPPTTYELQTVIVGGYHDDGTGWFYMYDRDLVDRSQWKRWQGNRPEKLAALPSPLIESNERICWLFYRRSQEIEHEPSPTSHSVPLEEPGQFHEESLDDQDVVTHDHTLDIIACRVCMSGDDSPDNQIVLCDACDEGIHQLCQVPPITEKHLAYDPWYCARCWQQYRERSPAIGIKRKFNCEG